MNINKFTQKSIEAVNRCEKIAYDYGNQEIDQEHFLYSLLTIEDSLISNLIEKMGIDNKTLDGLKHNRNITLLTVEKLCNILECTPDKIVEFI